MAAIALPSASNASCQHTRHGPKDTLKLSKIPSVLAELVLRRDPALWRTTDPIILSKRFVRYPLGMQSGAPSS